MDLDLASRLTTRSTLHRHGPYEITDDPDRVDLAVVHTFLSRESYWRSGVSPEAVAVAVRMSLPLSAVAAHRGRARAVRPPWLPAVPGPWSVDGAGRPGEISAGPGRVDRDGAR